MVPFICPKLVTVGFVFPFKGLHVDVKFSCQLFKDPSFVLGFNGVAEHYGAGFLEDRLAGQVVLESDALAELLEIL